MQMTGIDSIIAAFIIHGCLFIALNAFS